MAGYWAAQTDEPLVAVTGVRRADKLVGILEFLMVAKWAASMVLP